MSEFNETIEQRNLHAVTLDGNSIRYIDNPSEAVQLAAVNQFGMTIQHIQNPSEAVQLAAVTQNAGAINYIVNPGESVQIAAVQQDGSAIQFIQNPSETVQLVAIQDDGWWSLEHIQNPTEAVYLAVFAYDGFSSASLWPNNFRPGAIALTKAVQESGLSFSGLSGLDDDDGFFNEKIIIGIDVVRSCLINQPSTDILDLAAAAPDLFEPPELREILRNALLQKASPPQAPTTPRSF